MINGWKIFSFLIVLAVCLGLVLGPGVPGASAAGGIGIEVVPQETKVGFSEDFDVEIWINDTVGIDYNSVGVRLVYETKYVTCNAVTDSGIWDYTATDEFNNTWNSTHGLIKFDATMLGPVFNTSQKAFTVNFTSTSNTSNGGISGLDFIFIPADDATSVPDAGVDVLDWDEVVNGTVIIGDVFNLTVTSTGCCPITVGSLGTVAANSSQSFIVPCPNVTLTADDSGACCVFDNWTVDGNFTTSNPVIVTGAVNSTHNATASCSTLQYNLTMAVNGGGTTSPSVGTSAHSCGDVVNVSATADSGWWFVNWTGDLTGNTTPTTITIDGDKNVTANFVEQFTLTMAVTGNGTTDPAPGNYTVLNGTGVDINATPDSGWHFVNWTTANMSEIANATAALTVVTVDQNKTVTANFAINEYNLTINSTTGGNVTTPGEGTFGLYDHGTVVDLVATPDADYAFVHWSGDNGTIADVNSSTTNITMYGNYSIMAHFGPHDFSVLPTPLTFTTDEGENPPSQTLEICNTGNGTLDWSLSDNAAWLSGSPASGSLGEGECENVVVSVDVAGMGAGDYSATITFTGSLELGVPVSLHIESAMPDMLVLPAALSASALSISPQQVQPGQDVTISINVANTGGKTGSYNAVLYINSVVEDSQSVSVPAGTSKNVIFTVSKSQAGVYDVSVAGQSGQFEVVGGGGWFGGGGLGTGGIIAIVVIVIILVAAVIFILRGTTRPE
jgi:hypothetical protein